MLTRRNLAAIAFLTAIPLITAGCHAPHDHDHRHNHAAHKQSGDGTATLVLVGGRVWTGETPFANDVNTPREPTAVAIRGNRIIAVGSDGDIRKHVGPHTRIIDARAKRIIPGMTDSHTHVVSGGFQLARINLRDAASKTEFLAAIEQAAHDKKPGEWLLGGRWSVESWANPQAPTRDWLDPVTGNTPVFLNRMDGHQALVNSAALKIAGIDENGPADPVGGEIERDPQTGRPTGVLKESAMGLVSRHIPPQTPQARYEALLRAIAHASSLGVTSVHDMSAFDDIAAFRRAEREGKLNIRVTSYLSMGDWMPHLDRVAKMNVSSNSLRIAGFKGFMDGSLGSRTAYMREHYCDAHKDMLHPRGQLTALANSHEDFREKVAAADARGFQIAVHAIGDEANHLLLDAYEYARRRSGRITQYHRDEHTQHLHTEDIARFAELGVVASMQPFHKADDGRYAEKALCKDRLSGSYAFRQLFDAGAIVCFGSDWPVVTLNPFAGIDSAVNAQTLDGKTWLPGHSLTVAETLYCYTANPARAIGREAQTGSITPGKLADLVILDRDPLSVSSDQLAETKALMTIVDGEVVFER